MSAEHAPATAISSVPMPPALAELLELRAGYKADAEYIQEQIDRIDATLIIRLGTVGTHDVDGQKVEVREYTRTDYGAIEVAYPATTYPQLYATKTVLDQDLVKRQFSTDALDQYKVHGRKSVVVK